MRQLPILPQEPPPPLQLLAARELVLMQDTRLRQQLRSEGEADKAELALLLLVAVQESVRVLLPAAQVPSESQDQRISFQGRASLSNTAMAVTVKPL